MKQILHCARCGKYTLKQVCDCGGKTESSLPPKYSPDEKYAEYRRKVKEEEWKEKGLL